MVRLLAGILLACAALAGSAFPVHATEVSGAPGVAVVCPIHHSAHKQPGFGGPDDKGDGSGRCGGTTHACVPSTVPPLPPVLAPAPSAVFPPWLAEPDGVGAAVAPAPAEDTPDLTVLCVSRT